MEKISQTAAVYDEVVDVLGSSFDKTVPARDQLTDAQLKTIKANIVKGIMEGSIDFKKPDLNEVEVSRYVSGMVSNHLRKSKHLNGGVSYSPTSSGRGSRDTQLSELNKLLKTYDEGTLAYNQILEAIDNRKKEIQAEKTTEVKQKRKQKELTSIDFDALPANLQHLANNIVSEFSAE